MLSRKKRCEVSLTYRAGRDLPKKPRLQYRKPYALDNIRTETFTTAPRDVSPCYPAKNGRSFFPTMDNVPRRLPHKIRNWPLVYISCDIRRRGTFGSYHTHTKVSPSYPARRCFFPNMDHIPRRISPNKFTNRSPVLMKKYKAVKHLLYNTHTKVSPSHPARSTPVSKMDHVPRRIRPHNQKPPLPHTNSRQSITSSKQYDSLSLRYPTFTRTHRKSGFSLTGRIETFTPVSQSIKKSEAVSSHVPRYTKAFLFPVTKRFYHSSFVSRCVRKELVWCSEAGWWWWVKVVVVVGHSCHHRSLESRYANPIRPRNKGDDGSFIHTAVL